MGADSPAVANIDQFRLSGNHVTQIHKSIKMASVFVGNIPYGVTEDQLNDIFGEAGSVVSFRIVHIVKLEGPRDSDSASTRTHPQQRPPCGTLTDTRSMAELCELTVPTGNKKRLQSLFKRGSKKR